MPMLNDGLGDPEIQTEKLRLRYEGVGAVKSSKNAINQLVQRSLLSSSCTYPSDEALNVVRD